MSLQYNGAGKIDNELGCATLLCSTAQGHRVAVVVWDAVTDFFTWTSRSNGPAPTWMCTVSFWKRRSRASSRNP